MKPKREYDAGRRFVLKAGLGVTGVALGTLFSTCALGQVCRLPTPRQTLGPFFPDDGDAAREIRENLDFRLPIAEANDNDLTFVQGREGRAQGQTAIIRGHVLFGRSSRCVPQPGAVVIMWNASSTGRYNHLGDQYNTTYKHPKTGKTVERKDDENFQYWGRCITDAEGRYEFRTIVPGYYPIDLERGLFRPPHLHFKITTPRQPEMVTQLYFKGDAIEENALIQELNRKDIILRDPHLTREEQESLIVEYKPDADGVLVGNYDFVLTF